MTFPPFLPLPPGTGGPPTTGMGSGLGGGGGGPNSNASAPGGHSAAQSGDVQANQRAYGGTGATVNLGGGTLTTVLLVLVLVAAVVFLVAGVL